MAFRKLEINHSLLCDLVNWWQTTCVKKVLKRIFKNWCKIYQTSIWVKFSKSIIHHKHYSNSYCKSQVLIPTNFFYRNVHTQHFCKKLFFPWHLIFFLKNESICYIVNLIINLKTLLCKSIKLSLQREPNDFISIGNLSHDREIKIGKRWIFDISDLNEKLQFLNLIEKEIVCWQNPIVHLLFIERWDRWNFWNDKFIIFHKINILAIFEKTQER